MFHWGAVLFANKYVAVTACLFILGPQMHMVGAKLNHAARRANNRMMPTVLPPNAQLTAESRISHIGSDEVSIQLSWLCNWIPIHARSTVGRFIDPILFPRGRDPRADLFIISIGDMFVIAAAILESWWVKALFAIFSLIMTWRRTRSAIGQQITH